MANVKKKALPQHKAANICPAKPLAKAPFPLKSPFLASVIAGTQPCPWAGLRLMLRDPLGSATSHVRGAGAGAAGSDVPSGGTRAGDLPQLLQWVKYYIF